MSYATYPTPKNEETLKSNIEALFSHIGNSTDVHLSITGEEYVQFANEYRGDDVDTRSAEQRGLVCDSKEQAFRSIWINFLEYVETRPLDSTLYWRTEPEYHEVDGGLHRAYMRLLLSNR